nr:hypothetical protein [uncultured Prevotella sp.]
MHRRIVPPRFVRGGASADGLKQEKVAGEVLADAQNQGRLRGRGA